MKKLLVSHWFIIFLNKMFVVEWKKQLSGGIQWARGGYDFSPINYLVKQPYVFLAGPWRPIRDSIPPTSFSTSIERE